ncbi:MAG: porin family protein [Candidatus Dadabacteria bacterium]|nr:porin family protein [Candidatus Dadabacteria bacterium]
MTRAIPAFLFFLALFPAMPAPAFADAVPLEAESLNSARAALSGGDAEDALRILDSLDPGGVADRRTFDFVRGLVLMELGRPKEAVDSFKSVVNREPWLLRPRLELARAYFASGDYPNAKNQFEAVLSEDIPPAVRRNIEKFLSLMKERRSWTVDFAIGIAEDSNINESTSLQTVVIGGLPFRLSDDSRETGGRGVNFFLGGSWRTGFGGLGGGDTLGVSARLWVKDYGGESFDQHTFEVFPNYVKSLGGGEVAAGPVFWRSLLAGRLYEQSIGGRVEGNLPLSPVWRLSAGAEVINHEFPRNSLQDGNSAGARFSLTRLFGIRTASTLLAAAVLRRAGAGHLEYDEFSAGKGFYREMPMGFTVSLRADAARRVYREADPFFGDRREWTGYFSAGMANRLLSYRGFYPRVTVIHTRRDSSADFYDYTRTRFVFDITRRF